MPVTLTLSRKALSNVDDVAGRWQFGGGSVEQGKKRVANYASVKRATFQGTDQHGQNSARKSLLIYLEPGPIFLLSFRNSPN